MKKKFTARKSADVLSFIPHTLGFLPSNSVVLLALSGGRVGAALRLDLPGSEEDCHVELFAATAADYLRSDKDADSALLVLYTDQVWKTSDRPPHGRLIAALDNSLATAGLPVRGGWTVGTDYWRELYCTDVSCCPLPGRPVAQIRDSALNAELVYNGSTYSGSAAEAAAVPAAAAQGQARDGKNGGQAEASLPGPSQSPGPAAEIQQEAEQLMTRFSRSWVDPQFYFHTLQAWEGSLSASEAGALTSEAQSFLLASLTHNAVRDAIAIFACSSRDIAFQWASASGLLEAVSDGTKILPGQAAEPLPQAADPATARDWSKILIGDSSHTPRWDRVDATADLLRQLHSVGAGEARAAAGTLHAWIEWARGRGSHAHQRAEACLREQPGYRLAELVRELAGCGLLPAWARRRETAWPGLRHVHA